MRPDRQTLPVARVLSPGEQRLISGVPWRRCSPERLWPGAALTAGASFMIPHHSGMLVSASRTAAAPTDADQERERLRRELLRRIMDREARRRALRGTPR